MPRGIPNSGDNKQALLERRKEFLADIDARIKGMERREKALKDLKPWLARRKLDRADLGWMYRQMAPKREAKPVQSKKPLQPPQAAGGKANHLGKLKRGDLNGGYIEDGKHHPPKGDAEFRARVREARIDKGLSTQELGKKLKISGSAIASWEVGRYVPTEEKRTKLVKFLGLPAGLGREATAAMEVPVWDLQAAQG